ncbi:D-amino-acid transaminase [Paenibacillus flagellatus]|uniref:D-alanine aminotransferase n=1 Tax=Paenibacillus flagellatus TaxID=2211139 RepID=A0A2V5L1D7_9BACL|nr:D-amino-acid transaminase [Paenibacillus flagellatus]PYI56526.1 D-amino-acid transaminase [Paenibacillus flagellatus]
MILIDDRIVPEAEASVSYLDRGYVFGDGIYEVIRVYNGRLYEKEAHYDRLVRSAGEIGLSLPYPIETLDRLLQDLLGREAVGDGTVYLQVTRGVAPRTHAFPPAGTKPVLVAYCNELARPLDTIRDGLTAITRPDIRWLRCDIKSLNLLGSVLAKQEAVEQGAGDVILHREGTVTECSASNVMIVKDGVVFTHPADHFILHGITRAVVLRLAAERGIEVREIPYTLDELRQADEAFLTSTTMEVTPIVRIDGSAVGSGRPGPVTRLLQEAFEATIGA